MDLLKSSKLGSVHKAISNSKELSSKPMPQLSDGLPTIRLMFILEILLGLKSKQGDVLCAFLHGELEPDENVYVEMPLGFSQYAKNGTKKVLKLK